MNIAVAFPSFHRRGGVERVFVDVCTNLVARGHRVKALAREFDPTIQSPGVERVAIHHRRCLAFQSPNAFRQALIEKSGGRRDFDVLATFGVQSTPDSVVWVPSVHAEWLQIARRQSGLLQRIRRGLNPFHPAILRLEAQVFGEGRFRRLIALTDRVADELIEHYNVDRGRIDILPNGFDSSVFHVRWRDQRRQTREELNLPLDAPCVLLPANELRRKGYHPLVEAIESLRQKDLRLLVAGRFDRLEAAWFARKMGVADQVMLLGPRSDMAALYAAVDVVALPTSYEAWGLVIVEALACGTPVLTTRLAGAACAIVEASNGLLIDDPSRLDMLSDALKRLLGGEHARPDEVSRTATPYSWEHILPRYERILLAASS